MKELLKKLKNKKVFIVISILTLLTFIIGILLVSIQSKDNKDLITTSITSFFKNIKENKLNTQTLLYKSITNTLIMNIIVWLLGISIIGVPIVLVILGFKSLSIGFTISSILYTYKLNGIVKAIIYIISNLINLFVLFVITYYSINFSLMLFNYLFRKKEYNKKIIVNRYLKLLILSILISILTSVIDSFVLPKLFYLT